MLDRCAHAAEGMGERLTDTYRVADLIRARDAEVAEQVRAETLAAATWEFRMGGRQQRFRLIGPWEPTP